MKVVNYRRELKQIERKNILNKYKELRDSRGGLTPNMRRILLGVKPNKHRNFREDNSDMWYDIRTSVKNNIKDLELFCETAHPEQIREVFELKSEQKNEEIEKNPSIAKTLSMLLKDFKTYKAKTNPENDLRYPEATSIEKDKTWRAEIGYKIVEIGLKYFEEQELITTLAHKRVSEEVLDMLQSEINHIKKS